MNFINLNKAITTALICGMTFFAATVARAVPVVGSISTVEFGDGNSPDNWIVDTIDVAGGSIEIGIKAKNRFVGDIVPTAGFVYQAELGNSPTPDPGLARWNFEWSAIFTDLDPDDFVVMLGIDFKPNDPDLANRLFSDVTSVPELVAGVFQGSQNVGFNFWPVLFPGHPAIMPIDPFAAGIYQFSLELFEVQGPSLSRIDMTVQVQVLPEPGIVVLFSIGLLGLMAFRRRRVS